MLIFRCACEIFTESAVNYRNGTKKVSGENAGAPFQLKREVWRFLSSPVRGSDQDESTFIHAQANITGNGVTDAEDSLPYVQEEHPNKDVTQ